jgi:hypothetical protein
MMEIRASFVVVAPVLSLLALGAPVPNQKTVKFVFPSVIGTEWVYEVENDNKEMVYESIKSTENIDDKMIVTLNIRYEQVIGKQLFVEKSTRDVIVDNDGIYYANPFPEVISQIAKAICIPVINDTEWSEYYKKLELTRRCVISDAGTITVPAGSYKAYCVKTYYSKIDQPEYLFCEEWYSTSVGLIKKTAHPEKKTLVLKTIQIPKK